jgi:uncharacterized membrane protein
VIAIFADDAPRAFDFFLLVMLALLPLMGFAIWQARRGKIKAHATLMACSFLLFLIALIDFEWAARTMEQRPELPPLPMAIHLCFAVPALVLWIYQVMKVKHVLENPRRHAKLGRLIFALLVATVGTGAWVYAEMFG